MLRLTLDTSVVISAAQGQQHAQEVNQLVTLARNGHITLALATTFEVEQQRASEVNRLQNLSWLSGCPVHRHAAPFRLGYSLLGGGDVLVGGNTDQVAAAVEQILLPPKYRPGNFNANDAVFMDAWRRKINDVQHLISHHMSGYDAFVTRDDDDMLKKRDLLRSRVGIDVIDPIEAVQRAFAWGMA